MAFPIRFLIDECVSPTLANDARSRSFEAWHVNHRSLHKQPDYLIFKACLRDDLVLVTNNARDFLPLYAGADVHPGVVIILPAALRAEQRRLFAIVLDWIAEQRDLVNKLVEIGEDGLLRVSDFPAGQP